VMSFFTVASFNRCRSTADQGDKIHIRYCIFLAPKRQSVKADVRVVENTAR
jgi:hypothetical protein